MAKSRSNHQSKGRFKDRFKETSNSTDSSDNSCKKCHDEPTSYSPYQSKLIQKVYLVGLMAWILLILVLAIFPTRNMVEFIILLIPIVLFLIAFKSTPFISETVEKFMFQTNLLTFGLLIALPILSWVYDKSKHNKHLFLGLISTAIIFSILTLFDVWVPYCYLPIVKHVKSILQTFALTIFIFLLYRFFIERGNRDRNKQPKDSSTDQPDTPPAKPANRRNAYYDL